MPAAVRAAASAVVAALCAAAGLTIAQAYPIWPLLVIVLFAGWVVLAALRLPFALAGLLALLPVIDLAPHTGWVIFEEFDLLVLATAAGGYAARVRDAWMSPGAPRESTRFLPHLSVVSGLLLLVYVVSELVSMQRGVAVAGGFQFDWTQNYNGPLNSVRVLKGLVWALLVLPLLTKEIGRERGMAWIGWGLTAALGLCGLSVVQERFAFTGLADFSQDYRATGPFWEMHVGGATLDAFLVLTIPFAIREALHARRVAQFVGIGIVLAMAMYSALVTFSRGLYLALPVELAALAVLWVVLHRKRGGPSHWPLLVRSTFLTFGLATASVMMFRAGGYRALLSELVVFALAIRATPSMRAASLTSWFMALVGAAIVGVLGYVVSDVTPKGPYLIFAIATIACVLTLALPSFDASSTRSLVVCTAWLWVALSACVVAGGWGGRPAAIDAGIVMAFTIILFVATSRLQQSPWPVDLRMQLGMVGLALVTMAVVATMSAGAYMGGRLSSGRGDMQVRMDHWKEGLGRFHGTGDWLFGAGLGRFPETSLFAGDPQSAAGDFRVVQQAGERYLALSAPKVPYLGFGVLLRFTQVVSVRPNTRYVLTVVGRSKTDSALAIEVCEKHLIYSAGCAYPQTGFPADGAHWTTRVLNIDVPNLAVHGGLAHRPIVFSVAVGTPGATIDIRSLRLVGPDGIDALVNGDFADRTTRWFSSSDLNNAPYHISSFPLGTLFDQGLVGLGLLSLLTVAALVRTAVGRAHRHPDAPFLAAALCGVFVLGVFDNLIDAPRIAFLFYVVVLLGLALRNPRVAVVSRAAVASAPPPVPPPAPPPAPPFDVSADAAAERARRRQQAFGTRKRPDA